MRPSQAHSELDKGFGARPLSPFLPPLLRGQGKEGVLLPVGVGLPLARLSLAGHLLPLLLYIRGQGHPKDTQVDPRDHILSRVRCPLPP